MRSSMVVADMAAAEFEIISPDWPAPAQVRACTTTRRGGHSLGVYQALNLAAHVGDDRARVADNRQLLVQALALPAEPLWLNQVHSARVLSADVVNEVVPDLNADAVWSERPGQVCAVLTADCLPLLFCNQAGSRVASTHAGWRGLLAGVISATLTALAVPGEQVMVWLGPAIGPQAFEVGAEVFAAFVAKHPEYARAFKPFRTNHWLCDIYLLARIELQQAGIEQIYGGGLCSYSDPGRFYSYRRDGSTGRMASLIWLE